MPEMRAGRTRTEVEGKTPPIWTDDDRLPGGRRTIEAETASMKPIAELWRNTSRAVDQPPAGAGKNPLRTTLTSSTPRESKIVIGPFSP